jgi:hypothetical protein
MLRGFMMSLDYCRKWRSIVPVTLSKKRRVSARPPVLSKAARAHAKKVEGNRALAIKFLKRAGIIEKPGKLARPYR